MENKSVLILSGMIVNLIKTIHSMIYYAVDKTWDEDYTNGFRVLRQIIDVAEQKTAEIKKEQP